MGPVFQKIDCLALPVPELDAAVAFYASLGHELKWRATESAAFSLPDSNAEFIVMTDRAVRETDITVASVEVALERFTAAGGRVVNGPFDIPIGHCAVVADPWDNLLVLLDNTAGLLTTDADGNVTGVERPDGQVAVDVDHVVIHVNDWQASHDFYLGVLGMERVENPEAIGNPLDACSYRLGGRQINVHGPWPGREGQCCPLR